MCRAQQALEEERTARVEAEALAARLRSQLAGLREAQSSQQASAQQRLAQLQAHLASLASRVVSGTPCQLPLIRIPSASMPLALCAAWLSSIRMEKAKIFEAPHLMNAWRFVLQLLPDTAFECLLAWFLMTCVHCVPGPVHWGSQAVGDYSPGRPGGTGG